MIAVQYEGHDLSLTVKLLLAAAAFLLSIVSYAVFEDPIRRGVRPGQRAGAWLARRLDPYRSAPARPRSAAATAPRGGLLLWRPARCPCSSSPPLPSPRSRTARPA